MVAASHGQVWLLSRSNSDAIEPQQWQHNETDEHQSPESVLTGNKRQRGRLASHGVVNHLKVAASSSELPMEIVLMVQTCSNHLQIREYAAVAPGQ